VRKREREREREGGKEATHDCDDEISIMNYKWC
jgi:hypothetical protein